MPWEERNVTKLCYAKNSLNGYLLMRRAKKPFVLNMESVVLQETSGLRGIVILLVKNFHENLTTVPIAHPLKWKHWSSRRERKL